MWRVPYFVIWLYRRFVSPFLVPTCRFTPSCSLYASEAFRVHGVLKGAWMTLCRLARCHPWHPGGHDPVPPDFRRQVSRGSKAKTYLERTSRERAHGKRLRRERLPREQLPRERILGESIPGERVHG